MAEVRLNHIAKAYAGGPSVIRDISIDIQDREFVVLVGPSGCGKSTLLRMIAGLEEITRGDLFLDGQRINELAPKDRDIAMVFQNYALYPHMTVFDNMAFGLKLRNMPKAEIRQRVTRAAQILEIEPLLDRKPKDMSGGQRQRVAIGRAIVRNPKVFLFDEPLSNLDAKLRGQTRIELQKLHRDLQATMIYVTHDQVEAMTLGDRIVVLRNGDVMQHDTPLALYNQPANRFVAGFIGSPPMNFLPGRITTDTDQVYFQSTGGTVRINLDQSVHRSALLPYAGRTVELGIRAEHITDQPTTAEGGRFSPDTPTLFDAVERMGSETLAYFSLDGHRFIARLSGDAVVDTQSGIRMFWAIDKAHFFDIDTEQAIR
ncbi:ABC transporter ATP-binding protein [Spirosoma rigui]|uniref:ABC transporter ATP-binding protein n=1 Tax=Spirosoma rigui TaxID=564064 RepID=UPI0009B19AD7|nr:sn-glycerol-3-phosphate ABC transporter ATP-binding protein UgpC [Spirosoma rigui]